MANIVYNRGKFRLGDYKWDSDTVSLGVMLVNSSYTPSVDHNTIADVVANEASGSGYTRKTIGHATRTVSEDDTNDIAKWRVTDGTVVWSAIDAGTNLRVVVFFIDGADINDAANNLLCHFDSGTNIPIDTNGGEIGLNFHADGLLRVV